MIPVKTRVGRGQSLGGHGAASVAKERGKESWPIRPLWGFLEADGQG